MSQANVERLRGVYSAWADGDFAVGGDLFAPDVVFEPLPDGGSTYVGLEALGAYMREFLTPWSKFRVEAREMIEGVDVVVVTERQHGTGKSSGVETEMTFYAVWTFRDGLVVRARWESDRTRALEAAGLQE